MFVGYRTMASTSLAGAAAVVTIIVYHSTPSFYRCLPQTLTAFSYYKHTNINQSNLPSFVTLQSVPAAITVATTQFARCANGIFLNDILHHMILHCSKTIQMFWHKLKSKKCIWELYTFVRQPRINKGIKTKACYASNSVIWPWPHPGFSIHHLFASICYCQCLQSLLF